MQTDIAHMKTGGMAAVIALPGYSGAWNDRVVRTFLLAAKKAGADAVEIQAANCTQQTVAAAVKHELRVVVSVHNAEDIQRASECGVDIFHVDGDALADPALYERIAAEAACIMVSSHANAGAQPEMLAAEGITVIRLHEASKLLSRIGQKQAFFEDATTPCGWDGAGMDGIPAAVNGALSAAAGACVVRRHLAIARYFGEQDAPGHLPQKEFREMAISVRGAEKALNRQPVRRRIPGRDEQSEQTPSQPAPVKIYESETSAVFASEFIAKMVALVDCSAACDLDADSIEWLVARLKKAQHVDTLCALVTGSHQEAEARLEKCGVKCTRLQGSWLESVLAIAEENSAGAIALVPVENALIDFSHLDRMAMQHVRSAADITICSDMPRGTAARIISPIALHRINMFTGPADSSTVEKLLYNRRVFRLQDTIIDRQLRHPELDLTWHASKKEMLSSLMVTGDETCREIIARCTHLKPELFNPSESIPGSSISFVHCHPVQSDTL